MNLRKVLLQLGRGTENRRSMISSQIFLNAWYRSGSRFLGSERVVMYLSMADFLSLQPAVSWKTFLISSLLSPQTNCTQVSTSRASSVKLIGVRVSCKRDCCSGAEIWMPNLRRALRGVVISA